jgi:hypothetical protein
MIHHSYSSYVPSDPDSKRRIALAQASWKKQPWKECPVQDGSLPRLWKEEGKSLPYLRDVFDAGCNGHPDDDILVYTNSDIHVRSDACVLICCALADADACYAYRMDFPSLTKTPDDSDFLKGYHYSGSDLVACRVGWWKQHRPEMPDMLIGMEAWDPCIRTLIEETNPGKWTVVNSILAHERHASFWEAKENRYRFRGQKYNLQLAKQFMLSHGVNPKSHGIP